MTPELLAHWMDVFHLTSVFEGMVIAIVIIAIIAIGFRALGNK